MLQKSLQPLQYKVVQSIVSLTNSLMANSLTVVAKVFSNTLILLLQKCEQLLQCKSCSHFSAQNISVYVIFQDRNFNVTLAYSLDKFRTTGLRPFRCSDTLGLGLVWSLTAQSTLLRL